MKSAHNTFKPLDQTEAKIAMLRERQDCHNSGEGAELWQGVRLVVEERDSTSREAQDGERGIEEKRRTRDLDASGRKVRRQTRRVPKEEEKRSRRSVSG